MAIGKKDIVGVREGDDMSMYASGDAEIQNEHIVWHLIGGANTDHETLCGVDANDCSIGTFGTISPKAGQKVTCKQCSNEFFHVKRMNITKCDFDL